MVKISKYLITQLFPDDVIFNVIFMTTLIGLPSFVLCHLPTLRMKNLLSIGNILGITGGAIPEGNFTESGTSLIG